MDAQLKYTYRLRHTVSDRCQAVSEQTPGALPPRWLHCQYEASRFWTGTRALAHGGETGQSSSCVDVTGKCDWSIDCEMHLVHACFTVAKNGPRKPRRKALSHWKEWRGRRGSNPFSFHFRHSQRSAPSGPGTTPHNGISRPNDPCANINCSGRSSCVITPFLRMDFSRCHRMSGYIYTRPISYRKVGSLHLEWAPRQNVGSWPLLTCRWIDAPRRLRPASF